MFDHLLYSHYQITYFDVDNVENLHTVKLAVSERVKCLHCAVFSDAGW